MPFDGIVVKCVVLELNKLLSGGRIDKIYQPASDRIVIHIYSNGNNYKLLASANASSPGIYITEEPVNNPPSPPMFCMLLRKHLSGGRVINFVFNDYERIVNMKVDTINELGDRVTRKLVIEIMGRYSNIILVDEKERIIDSIRHVDEGVSRVREVMPARPYIRPPAQDKENLETLNICSFVRKAEISNKTMQNYLLDGIRGFSPYVCSEICKVAGIDENKPANTLTVEENKRLENALKTIIESVKNNNFVPLVLYNPAGKPVDFHCLNAVSHDKIVTYETISKAIDTVYLYKDLSNKVNAQKNTIMKKIQNELRKCYKKQKIHQKNITESADSERLKLYGELITANIHSIPPFAEKASLLNYYSEDRSFIEIPLDRNLTPQENAQRYYKKYALAKRTYSHASKQLKQTLNEIEYLENVLLYLENCNSLSELDEIREELVEQGIISTALRSSKKKDSPSQPYRYISSDGFHIYVGRNNRQNDILTQQSSPNDIWFHTRNIPGSHVIVKSNGREVPFRTMQEAAVISAVHSKARKSPKVPVDYTLVKHVRKPKGSKPGMVIYENFKTIVVDADKSVCDRLAIKERQ